LSFTDKALAFQKSRLRHYTRNLEKVPMDTGKDRQLRKKIIRKITFTEIAIKALEEKLSLANATIICNVTKGSEVYLGDMDIYFRGPGALVFMPHVIESEVV